jgi:hypothetical protein
MNKKEAHELLDRIKSSREPVSIFVTTAALERTGDICGIFSESLRAACEKPRDHRTRQVHDQEIPKGFSYSAYLDKTKTERTA